MVLRRGTTLLLAAGVVPVVLVGLTADGQAGRTSALATLGAWLLLVVVLVAVDLALAVSPRLLRFERTVPARVRLGEPAEVVLVVVNPAGRRFRGLVRDAWQPSAGQTVSRTPLDVPAGERRAFTYSLVPRRRGERRVEQVTARSSGPLGLAARQATVLVPGRIRVLPAFRSRRHLPSRLRRLRELDGRTTAQVRGEGTEFDSIREYVRGDDVRSIDWRATARGADLPGAGRRLMLRTWRPERDRRIVVVVDTGRTAAARIGDEPRLDTAFEATLLLAALASRAGDRVDLLAYDRRVRGRVAAASATTVLAQMVEAMAPLEAELLETDWSAIPGQVRRLTSGRALVVLLTAVDSVGSARGLLAALPQLTARHLVVVAGATDPGLGRLAADRDPRQVYRAAAAERALLDQDRVAAAIRQSGADVVTGAPEDLPPALADRYLALKAAGRL